MTCRPLVRARGRRKGSSFRKIAELATRRDIPARNYSRPGSSSLSAITNEPPVIENNRCVRVMPPKDRVLARGSASIYELVGSARTTATSRCMCSQPRSLRANLSNNLHFRAPFLQPPLPYPFTPFARSRLRQRRLSPSSVLFLLWPTNALFVILIWFTCREIVKFITKLQRDLGRT